MSKFSYQLLDLANPVFASFVVWSSVLILKTLFMSAFTGFYRFKNKVSLNIKVLVVFIRLWNFAWKKNVCASVLNQQKREEKQKRVRS